MSGNWHPPVHGGDRRGDGGRPPLKFRNDRPYDKFSPFPREIICHYCNKPGHLKSHCPVLQKRGATVGVDDCEVSCVRAQKEPSGREGGRELECLGLMPAMQPVSDVTSVRLKQFGKYVSEGAVAVTEGTAEASVTVLRDTASGISILLAGTIDLPETAAIGIGIGMSQPRVLVAQITWPCLCIECLLELSIRWDTPR